MLDAATGFVVVGVAILVGWIIGRIDLLGEHGGHVLSRLTFFVLSPFLLFVVLAQADVAVLFSSLLPVSIIAAAGIILLYLLVARLAWKRSVGDALVGALAAGQVNSNNIGIPLSLYLLGSAAYPAPVVLMQLLVLTPITMTVFESLRAGRGAWRTAIRRTVTNPVLIGSALGVLVALTDVTLPQIALGPANLIANACIPVLLINYGMSLHGQRVLATPVFRKDILLATTLKLIAMPALAWVFAALVFALPRDQVLICVVLAALPSAQNVFNYAQRYDQGLTIARDTIFLTTIGCIPVLLAILALLG